MTNKLINIWICILSALLLFPVLTAANEPLFFSDITYAKVDTIELQLNIAVPSVDKAITNARFPLLLFIHGGGWRTGHRNAYNKQIQNAASKGYVAATISHRLTSIEDKNGKPLYPWPAAIHDCKAAIRYLKSVAEQYHIDTTRIGATGGSSGGHLSLLMGLTQAKHGLEGDMVITNQERQPKSHSSRIHAVVNIAGPTEMISCHKAPVVTPFSEYLLQGSPTDNPDAYFESSPINYITKDCVPILTIQGTMDDVVPFEQAVIFDNRMKAAGALHELYPLKGQKHILNAEASNESWRVLYAFFDKHLKK